ncbi:outer membrane beta-barrel protein [Porphyromonas sp. COT-239 OH1446]|uniref:outer membrane beta-barrel protein n=1 Tax=Porphyromonas sp. COT-239 OH1446 TaxID=1515613 RepID=UPI00052DC915|nr:outer membrane beta-barrel protein [Porphyromonas sp. COT-239 OH1446]KGN70275.1 hypothetical protein HQ37_04340 [Porphyromonas sp. COT-239 OH1446]
MKRLTLLVLCLLSGLWTNLSAQDHPRWTIGLSAQYGTLARESDRTMGAALIPSVRYHFGSSWSVGGALHLPLASARGDWAVCHTTGLELSLSRGFELLPQLRLTLSAVGLWGITGPYKVVSNTVDAALPPGDPGYGKLRVDYQSSRWLVGLRPGLSYRFARGWSVELGYGLLGYRSNKMLDETYTFDGKSREGAWGFNTEAGWGNGLRVGLSYSF